MAGGQFVPFSTSIFCVIVRFWVNRSINDSAENSQVSPRGEPGATIEILYCADQRDISVVVSCGGCWFVGRSGDKDIVCTALHWLAGLCGTDRRVSGKARYKQKSCVWLRSFISLRGSLGNGGQVLEITDWTKRGVAYGNVRADLDQPRRDIDDSADIDRSLDSSLIPSSRRMDGSRQTDGWTGLVRLTGGRVSSD
ncbi:hypothetical protein RRG08_050572 [Elysia crispata]|uniref:Uncharacterized protein n=1 Tax=Elysia crispata TaxID=231223 RepID=A0AAE0Z6S9_9GAST|nr:hypothetical protein RRG08_050572 [Elysia crispata]